jgi:hypothetical protein
MNPETCPQLYTCSKVRMTPMIRVLLRCTAAEAMRSICKNCEDRLARGGTKVRTSGGSESFYSYVGPSGKKLTVMVGGEGESGETSTG